MIGRLARAGLRDEWTVRERPWALHATLKLGNPTDRWIAIQVATQLRYGARLLGRDRADDAPLEPGWLCMRERPDLSAAASLQYALAGISSGWLALPFLDERPAVLHGHYGPVAATMRTAANALRVPLVATFYGYDASQDEFTGRRVWRSRYRKLFAQVGAVTAEGPRMAERVAALGCPERLIHVVRLPADAAGLAAVEPVRSDGFVVALAGRFAEKKGFDTGIKAFARALRGRDDATLMLIGGGPLEDDLRKLAAREGIGAQTAWRGRLPFAEFMTALGGASIALYPSRTAPDGDTEGGAPVTLIEAQWLGVPSLISDHDDLPFVTPPDGRVVLTPTDVDAWADALLAAYEDRDATARMGAVAREFVQEHHTPAANAEAREAIYAALG